MKYSIPALLLLLSSTALIPAAEAQMLDAKVISLDAAKKIAAAAEAEARKQGWAASLDLAIAKARTSARFRRPTKALSDGIAAGRLALLAAEGYLPLEGGVPVIVGGKVGGASRAVPDPGRLGGFS